MSKRDFIIKHTKTEQPTVFEEDGRRLWVPAPEPKPKPKKITEPKRVIVIQL
jgi:hypothetical protein